MARDKRTCSGEIKENGQNRLDYSDLQIPKLLTKLQFSTPPEFGAPVGGDPGRISRRSLASENYRLPGLSRGVVCVILRLAVSVEHRLVTSRQTDIHGHWPVKNPR